MHNQENSQEDINSSDALYLKYFGLKEAPFSIAPNPRYLFMSEQHREALAHLLYGVGGSGGFVLLSGEVGAGKTTISRCLLGQLPAHTDIAYILNPMLNQVELLAAICDELSIDYVRDDLTLHILSAKLYRFLIENHRQGRNTVLLIDEAQNLGDEVLEQVRLLTNLETNSQKLLQIIFVAQPELNDRLSDKKFRQLSQRITARFHIESLSLPETKAYIRHRLSVAGSRGRNTIFTIAAIKLIYRQSAGIPRVINTLCDRLLLGVYAQNKTQIDSVTIKKAIAEISGEKPPHSKAPLKIWNTALLASCLLVTSGLALYLFEGDAVAQAQVSNEARIVNKTDVVSMPLVINEAAASVIEDEPESAVIDLPFKRKIDVLLASKQQVLNQLNHYLNVFNQHSNQPCDTAREQGWRCESSRVESWAEFRQINRPAAIRITGEYLAEGDANSPNYLLVLAVTEGTAWVSNGVDKRQVSLVALSEYWRGELIFLWRAPEVYQHLTRRGDNSEFVTWLAAQFALLDGQSKLLAERIFNEKLHQRVKLFQLEQGLLADGIVGVRTLLKLNEKMLGSQTLDIAMTDFSRIQAGEVNKN